KADIAAASCSHYMVYQVGAQELTPMWSASVQDLTGLATATAFDFLGSGVAEAIYADEKKLWVFDGKTGQVDLTADRTSGTIIEYPVVADIDNDGSAEILFVSNYDRGDTVGPTVTALRDQRD